MFNQENYEINTIYRYTEYYTILYDTIRYDIILYDIQNISYKQTIIYINYYLQLLFLHYIRDPKKTHHFCVFRILIRCQ